MWVALTGTPGTGKTSVSALLQKQGYTIAQLQDLALKYNCIDGIDKKRNTQLIDMNKLNKYINKNFKKNVLIFFEGHLAHLLTIIDVVIILRCHPRKLKKRLLKKKWSANKIKENINAEALDIILCETVEYYSKEHIFEIDTTNKTIEEVASTIKHLVKKNFRPTKKYTIGQIDWSYEILKKYLT
jgi:adenylate kinase